MRSRVSLDVDGSGRLGKGDLQLLRDEQEALAMGAMKPVRAKRLTKAQRKPAFLKWRAIVLNEAAIVAARSRSPMVETQ